MIIVKAKKQNYVNVLKQYKIKSVSIIDRILTHGLVQIHYEHGTILQWKALNAKKPKYWVNGQF